MVVNNQQILDSVASLLRVKLPNDNSKEQPKSSNITSTIFELMKAADNSVYVPKSDIETAEIHQWIEYGIVYAAHLENPQNVHSLLRELNDILTTKTYFAAPKITIADAFIYYILLKTMASLSNLEKENYLNVCRWFDTIQNKFLRKKSDLVDFSAIFLATLVPARH